MDAANPDSPRPRPWYKNTALAVGFFVLTLGVGNWITGEIRTTRHQREALGLHGTAERPVGKEEIEIARSRMDFYHVVATGGRALTALGLLLMTGGLAHHLRGRAEKR